MLPRLPSRTQTAVFYTVSLAFLYLRSFRLSGTPMLATGDQMLFFTRAQRVLQGQVIYRDFFEMVTPGTEWLHAAVLAITGIHSWVPPLLTVTLGMLYCVLMTHLSRIVLPGYARFLPALVFLALVANNALDLTHHWYSALLALSAIAVLAPEVTPVRVASASVLCGMATMFTQTQGLGAFLGLCLFVGMYSRKLLAVLLMPYLLVVASGLGVCALGAGSRVVFYHLVLFPLRYMSSGDMNSPRAYLRQIPPLHHAGDIPHLLPVLFVYLTVPYAYVLAGLSLRRSRNEIAPAQRNLLLLLIAIGVGLFLGVATAPRLYRLSTVAAPGVILLLWWMSRWPRLRFALVTMAVAFFVVSPLRRQVQKMPILTMPTGRAAFTDPNLFLEYQWLAQRTRPDNSFFNEPGLQFYLALHNPTASEFVNYGEFTRPEQVDAVLHDLQRDPPQYIVLSLSDRGLGLPGDSGGPFRDFMHTHYEETARFFMGESTQYSEAIWQMSPKPKN